MNREIPKKIHFIWLGGPIPEKYLREIMKLSAVAYRSKFEVILWVDHQINYHKTLNNIHAGGEIFNIRIPGLYTKNIYQLYHKMKKELFYMENNQLNNFWKCVERELIGFKNLAAASDFLRYEILRQEGGYYFDTDTQFNITSKTKLIADCPHFGIKTNLTSIDGKTEKLDYNEANPRYITTGFKGSNDVIGSLPDHAVLQAIIVDIITSYEALDRSAAEVKRASFKIHKNTTDMDLKRYPTKPPIRKYFWEPRSQRTELSIETAGPGALARAITKLWKVSSDDMHTLDVYRSLTLENTWKQTVAGMDIVSRSDRTWVYKEHLHSFDDSDIPSNTISRLKR